MAFKNNQNWMKMSSNFTFTSASWFPGNVRVKPISTHSAAGWRGSQAGIAGMLGGTHAWMHIW